MTTFHVTVKTATADVAFYILRAASAAEAVKGARSLVKEHGYSRKLGTLLFRARKGAPAPVEAPKAKKVSRAKKAPARTQAAQPMTDLEFKLFDTMAHCEMTACNGDTPTSHSQIWTYLWADERASALGVSEQAIGGLFTSLAAKGFAHIQKPTKGDPDGGFTATEAGFNAWKSMR
jgi:hypothetical protein